MSTKQAAASGTDPLGRAGTGTRPGKLPIRLAAEQCVVTGERFQLTRLIGLGARGAVYQARDLRNGATVALKFLACGVGVPTPVAHELPPPLIGELAVHLRGEEAADSFVVMDLAAGNPLDQLVPDGNGLPPAKVIALLEAACDALGPQHARGRVHGNLKPGNLFVGADQTIRLGDFLDTLRGTRHGSSLTGALRGLNPYMAPEVAGFDPPTRASDVFSLGVIGCELLTGRHPLAGADLRTYAARLAVTGPEFPAGCPEGLRHALTAAMAAAPVDRPQDAGQLAKQLRSNRRLRRPRGRWRRRLLAGLAILATGLVLGLALRLATGERGGRDLARADELAAAGDLPGAIDGYTRLLDSSAGSRSKQAAREGLEQLLRRAAATGDTETARRAAARVASWRWDDPEFYLRHAALLAGPAARGGGALGAAADAPSALGGRDSALAERGETAAPGEPADQLLVDRRNEVRRAANQALSAGDYSLARTLFLELAGLDPEDRLIGWRLQQLDRALSVAAAVPGRDPAATATAVDGAAEMSLAREIASRGDHVSAAEHLRLALDAPDHRMTGSDADFAARVYFNASVALARLGECGAALGYADRGARFDDPQRPMSNHRWRTRLSETEDCKSGRFQAFTEGLALK